MQTQNASDSALRSMWPKMLEALSNKTLDEGYISSELSPFISDTSLMEFSDNLGETIYGYAISYQNEDLLKAVVKIAYDTFDEKAQKRIADSIYRSLKLVCKMIEKHADFFQNAFEIIANSQLKDVIKRLLEEGKIRTMFDYIPKSKSKSLRVMQHIMNLLMGPLECDDYNKSYAELKQEYETRAKEFSWKRMAVKNLMKSPNFDLEFTNSSYFHQVILDKQFSNIAKYKLLEQQDAFFRQDSSGNSPMHLLFRTANAEFLDAALQNIIALQKSKVEKVNQTNKSGQTFLHHLLHNKSLDLDSKCQLIEKLSQGLNIDACLQQPDHNDMTPLSLFIGIYFKDIKESPSKYWPTLKILIPKPKTSGQIGFAELYFLTQAAKIKKSNFNKLLKRDDFYNNLRQEFVQNQKVLKLCIDYSLNETLYSLLNECSNLTLDTICFESLGTARHFIQVIAESGNIELIDFFFSKQLKRTFEQIDGVPKYLSHLEIANEKYNFILSADAKPYLSFSIFASLMDTLNALEQSEVRDYIAEKFAQLWNNFDSSKKATALMSLSYQRTPVDEVAVHPLFARMAGSDVEKIRGLFKSDSNVLGSQSVSPAVQVQFLKSAVLLNANPALENSNTQKLVKTNFDGPELKKQIFSLIKYGRQSISGLFKLFPDQIHYLFLDGFNHIDTRSRLTPIQEQQKLIKSTAYIFVAKHQALLDIQPSEEHNIKPDKFFKRFDSYFREEVFDLLSLPDFESPVKVLGLMERYDGVRFQSSVYSQIAKFLLFNNKLKKNGKERYGLTRFKALVFLLRNPELTWDQDYERQMNIIVDAAPYELNFKIANPDHMVDEMIRRKDYRGINLCFQYPGTINDKLLNFSLEALKDPQYRPLAIEVGKFLGRFKKNYPLWRGSIHNLDHEAHQIAMENGLAFEKDETEKWEQIFTYGWQPITSLISRIQGNGWKLQGQELESFNKIISLILEKYDNDTLKAMDQYKFNRKPRIRGQPEDSKAPSFHQRSKILQFFPKHLDNKNMIALKKEYLENFKPQIHLFGYEMGHRDISVWKQHLQWFGNSYNMIYGLNNDRFFKDMDEANFKGFLECVDKSDESHFTNQIQSFFRYLGLKNHKLLDVLAKYVIDHKINLRENLNVNCLKSIGLEIASPVYGAAIRLIKMNKIYQRNELIDRIPDKQFAQIIDVLVEFDPSVFIRDKGDEAVPSYSMLVHFANHLQWNKIETLLNAYKKIGHQDIDELLASVNLALFKHNTIWQYKMLENENPKFLSRAKKIFQKDKLIHDTDLVNALLNTPEVEFEELKKSDKIRPIRGTTWFMVFNENTQYGIAGDIDSEKASLTLYNAVKEQGFSRLLKKPQIEEDQDENTITMSYFTRLRNLSVYAATAGFDGSEDLLEEYLQFSQKNDYNNFIDDLKVLFEKFAGSILGGATTSQPYYFVEKEQKIKRIYELAQKIMKKLSDHFDISKYSGEKLDNFISSFNDVMYNAAFIYSQTDLACLLMEFYKQKFTREQLQEYLVNTQAFFKHAARLKSQRKVDEFKKCLPYANVCPANSEVCINAGFFSSSISHWTKSPNNQEFYLLWDPNLEHVKDESGDKQFIQRAIKLSYTTILNKAFDKGMSAKDIPNSLELAFDSHNTDCFELVLKNYFSNSDSEILSYFTQNRIIIRAFSLSTPSFGLGLLSKFCSIGGACHSEADNLILQADQWGRNALHYIAFSRKPQFFYQFMNGLTSVFGDESKAKEILSELVNVRAESQKVEKGQKKKLLLDDDDDEDGGEAGGEDEFEDQEEKGWFISACTPLEYAFHSRFYEFFCYFEGAGIELQGIDENVKISWLHQPVSFQARFPFFKTIDVKEDDHKKYGQVYEAYYSLYQSLVGTIGYCLRASSMKKLNSNWKEIIENLVFYRMFISKGDINAKAFLDRNVDINQSCADILVFEFYPQIITTILEKQSLANYHYSYLLYVMECTYENLPNSENEVFKDIFKRYKKGELQIDDKNLFRDCSKQVQTQEGPFKQIEEVKAIASYDQENQQFRSQLTLDSIDEEGMKTLISKLFQQQQFSILKLLVLNKKDKYMTIPEQFWTDENYNHEQSFNFWLDLTESPKTMVELLSELSDGDFNTYVYEKLDSIMEYINYMQKDQHHSARTKPLLFVISYILFSQRGPGSKNKIADYFEAALKAAIQSEPQYNNRYLRSLLIIFEEILAFFSTVNLKCSDSDNLSNQSVLQELVSKILFASKEISFNIMPLGDQEIAFENDDFLNEEQDMAQNKKLKVFDNRLLVNISEDNLKNIAAGLTKKVINNFEGDNNTLIVYSSMALATMKLLMVFDDLNYIAINSRKQMYIEFVIDDNAETSFTRSITTFMAMVKCEIENGGKNNFMLTYDQRSIMELQSLVDDLFIMDKIKARLDATFTDFMISLKDYMRTSGIEDSQKPDPQQLEITLNNDSLKQLSYFQKQQVYEKEINLKVKTRKKCFNFTPSISNMARLFGIHQVLKQTNQLLNYEVVYGRYSIDEQNAAIPPAVLKTDSGSEFILHEFYEFVHKSYGKINVNYLPPHNFKKELDKQVSPKALIRHVGEYEQQFVKLCKEAEHGFIEWGNIEKPQYEWYFTYLEDKKPDGRVSNSLDFCSNVPYSDLLYIRSIMKTFEIEVNDNIKQNTARFKWKINTKSILETLCTDLLEAVRNSKDKSKSIFREVGEYDIISALNYFLNHSLFRNLLKRFIANVNEDISQIFESTIGFYFVFEKVDSSKVSEMTKQLNCNIADKVLGISTFKARREGKMVVVTVPYAVMEKSFDKVLEEPMVEDTELIRKYMIRAVGLHNLYTQFFAPRDVINIIMNKKAIQDHLLKLSSEISSEIKKNITFQLYFDKFYDRYEGVIIEIAKNNEDAEDKFGKVQYDLRTISEYIQTRFGENFKKQLLKREYNEYFNNALQIQNYLYNEKIPISKFADRDYHPYSLDKVDISNTINSVTVSKLADKNKRFSFFIQTNKGLTVRNASKGQEFVMCSPSKTSIETLKEDAMKHKEDSHYLLISSSWPDLEFCGHDYSRILVSDLNSKLLDLNNSALAEIFKILTEQNQDKFDSIAPYLVNTSFKFDHEITVNNLIGQYPSIFQLSLTQADEELTASKLGLKSLKSKKTSQVFDEQKKVELYFNERGTISMKPIEPETIKYHQKLFANPHFQNNIINLQKSIQDTLKEAGVKEFIDSKKLTLPQFVIEFSTTLNIMLDMNTSSYALRVGHLIEDFGNILYEALNPQCSDSNRLQYHAQMTYDDIAYENNYLSIKAIEFFMEYIRQIKVISCEDELETKFNFDNKEWYTVVSVDSEEQTIDFQDKRQILDSFYTNVIGKLIQNHSQKYGSTYKFDFEIPEEVEQQRRVYSFLLAIDFTDKQIQLAKTILNSITGENSIGNINVLVQRNLNDNISVELNGITLSITLSISDYMDFEFPDYQQLLTYMITAVHKIPEKSLAETVMSFKVQTPTFKYIDLASGGDFSFEVQLPVQKIEDIYGEKSVPLRAFLFGLATQSSHFLTATKQMISKETQSTELQGGASGLPSQPYLLCIVLDNQLLLNPTILLAHHKDPNFKHFKSLLYFGDRMSESQNYISIAINEAFDNNKEIEDNIVMRIGEKRYLKRRYHHLENFGAPQVPSQTRNHTLTRCKVISDKEQTCCITPFETANFKGPFSTFSVFSSNAAYFPRTKVTGEDGNEYKNVSKAFNKKELEKTITNKSYCQLMKNLIDSSEKAKPAEIIQKGQFITSESVLQTEDMANFMNENTLQNIKDVYYTKAGKTRVESLEFVDQNGELANVDNKEKLDIKFVHNKDYKIQVPADSIVVNGSKLEVKWTPLLKGTYSMLIENEFVDAGQNLTVLAAEIDIQKSVFRAPTNRKYAYFNPLKMEIEFRDKFGNRINQLELQKEFPNNESLNFKWSLPSCTQVKSFNNVNFKGVQNISITMKPENIHEAVSGDGELEISFKDKVLEKIQLEVIGVGLDERKKQFLKDISSEKKGDGSYNISREIFLEDLNKFELKKFKSVSSVTFKGEPGIDAGGLKREFWDMIGGAMRQSKYMVFNSNNNKLFFSPKYKQNEKTFKIIKLFGALLASSILNNGLIGIEFATGTMKSIYGEDVTFEDLREIFDEQEYKNYEMMKTMSNEELESLETYFVHQHGNQEVELQTGGASIQVNKENVSLYLDLLAKSIFKECHTKAIEEFSKGFGEIFPLYKMKQWINAGEVVLLTRGAIDLTANDILSVCQFHGSETLETMFRRYLQESSDEIARKFLKFTTGSSSIPFERGSYRVSVRFISIEQHKLPIAHTCSLEIEMPKYKSYEQLRNKLNIAFLAGAEGFGFG